MLSTLIDLRTINARSLFQYSFEMLFSTVCVPYVIWTYSDNNFWYTWAYKCMKIMICHAWISQIRMRFYQLWSIWESENARALFGIACRCYSEQHVILYVIWTCSDNNICPAWVYKFMKITGMLAYVTVLIRLIFLSILIDPRNRKRLFFSPRFYSDVL